MHTSPRSSRALLASVLALLLAACGGGGGGSSSPDATSAPAGVRLEATTRSLTVAWGPVPGATGYNVYVAASPAVSAAAYDDLPEGRHAPAVPTDHVRFDGLTDGATYWAVVTALVGGVEGPASSAVSVVLPVGRVTGLSTRGDVHTVRVAWTSARGADAYEVYVATTPDVSPDAYERRVESVGPSVLVDGLENGATYWFVVRARNAQGEGPASRPISGVPDGRGSLEDVTAFLAGEGATDLLLADLDNDGRDEIVVANRDAGTVQSFASGATPREPFVLVGELAVPGDVPTAIGVLDADGDGLLDLAVARRDDGTVTVHRGLGDGSFEEVALWTILVGASPEDLVVADVNADGWDDILTADRGGPGVSLALGQATAGYWDPVYGTQPLYDWVPVYDEWGNYLYDDYVQVGEEVVVVDWVWVQPDPFLPATNVCTAYGPVALSAADVDQDGDVDLLVLETTIPRLTVLKNDGTGTFSTWDQLSLPSVPDAITLADTNGDGAPDAFLTSEAGGAVLYYVNDGTGHFSEVGDMEPTPTPVDTVTADMNGDGLLDLVVADLVQGQVSIYLGTRSGTFEEHFRLSPADSVARVRATDVDGDGVLDLVVTDPAGGSVLVLYGAKK